ncbi:hypothetical protein GOP47_0015941 [Adiantum capillus-veneris]|uniref:Calcineurin-like phosphoesterase domain-containing protein n=1 Tax=Adiantum capillus-veneris TaxID=13818 RepID=A0A9D4ZDP2_ADICA|nr:hypothetical protein GOP47_0015941 [Adiantum capillus-veneris]
MYQKPIFVEFRTFWDPKADGTSEAVRVVVIADPQLTDRTTHGMQPDSFALKATQFYSDIYMRRAFRTTVMNLQPDEIIFLGDYFDGGPSLSATEFNASLDRFWHIFDQSKRGLRSRSVRVPYHFLFGNHDLGYAGVQSERPELLERYERAFGPIEHMDKIGAVNFVFADAQSLDGNLDDKHSKRAWSFVENVSTEAHKQDSKVLLSHIPLYRPDDTHCGALRSSEIINQRITWSRSAFNRIIYQNYLSEETTVRLLDLLRPVLVLSGHDHDQCSIKHRTSSVSVVEHTIGSFSWQNGNLYPSFLLLSVNSKLPSTEEGILSSRLCFLPYQTFIYIWYAVLFIISLVTLLAWPPHGIDLSRLLSVFKPQGGAKAKDEDALYDYEMVWDAEGSMHLIHKPSGHGGFKSTNQSAARSTALAQSVTKRTSASDPSSTVTSPNEQTTPESSTSLVGRSSRSTVTFIVRRLRQAMGPLVALATLNVGLYVMMMMNDWTGL